MENTDLKKKMKPFSCKLCDKSFFQVYQVKEHIKIHNSISEVEDFKNPVKSLKYQVKELKMKLESSQRKPQTRQKNRFQQKDMNQLKENNNDVKKGKKKVRENTLEEKTDKLIKIKGTDLYSCSYCKKKFRTET